MTCVLIKHYEHNNSLQYVSFAVVKTACLMENYQCCAFCVCRKPVTYIISNSASASSLTAKKLVPNAINPRHPHKLLRTGSDDKSADIDWYSARASRRAWL